VAPSSTRAEPVVERSIFASFWEARSEQSVDPGHEATAPAEDEDLGVPLPRAPKTPPAGGTGGAGGAESAEPSSILKSGVVDGMAYTLYSDGSIEAELPEGTVRFASIAKLREHLEQLS
jgi:hypothetical protein